MPLKGSRKKISSFKALSKTALRKGQSLKLKAAATPENKKLKVKEHRPVRFESSSTKVAAVSKKGVVRAKAKGTCYIYAYAQNGVANKIRITVE